MGINKRKIFKKLSRAQAVLNDIADTFEYIYNTDLRRIPLDVHGVDAYRAWRDYDDWKRRKRQIYYLRQRKLIEAQKVGERFMVRLTEQGYRRTLETQIRSVKRKCADGFCLVTFDIPESQRNTRDMFRRLLRECDFQQLHQSVWFSDKDVQDPLLAFVKSNKLTPWVHVVVGRIATTESTSTKKK